MSTMGSFVFVMSICALMGISLGILARNKGYNYWRWFFIGFIPAFFPFGLIWILLKKPELKDRDMSGYKDKDNDFVRKMKEFDKTHK